MTRALVCIDCSVEMGETDVAQRWVVRHFATTHEEGRCWRCRVAQLEGVLVENGRLKEDVTTLRRLLEDNGFRVVRGDFTRKDGTRHRYAIVGGDR